MQTLKFTKMHGIGNDFIVINCLTQNFTPFTDIIRKIAHRKIGIGCDQVLLIEPSTNADIDFNYRIFNATGEEVEHCGNGARCVVKYLIEYNISHKSSIKLQTKTTSITGNKLEDGMIQVNMGIPSFEPFQLAFLAEKNEHNNYHIIVSGELIQFGIVSMGNPHAVIKVPEQELQKIHKLGRIAKALQDSPQFTKGVNVSFYDIKARNNVQMRTYERGCGFTEACGTGACAVVSYNVLQGELSANTPIKVNMPGGILHISWDKIGDTLMSGDATIVFDGEINASR